MNGYVGTVLAVVAAALAPVLLVLAFTDPEDLHDHGADVCLKCLRRAANR